MKLKSIRALSVLALLTAIGGCDHAPSLRVERLPDVQPDLPEVPQIPPPPAAFPDGSVPIARLRRSLAENLDHETTVQGYIVEIYQPPECPRRQQCPLPTAPHLYLADSPNEGDESKRLLIVGYAATQEEYETLVRLGARRPPGPDGQALPPVDFAVGNRVKFTGQFVTTSMASPGFSSTAGLVDYARHETVEVAAPAAPAQ